MKISILQENFVNTLNMVTKFVPSKPSMPILSNILLKADGQGLEITANNMETAIRLQAKADVLEEGAISLPAKLLTEYVHLLSPGTIEIELTDSVLHLKSGRHKAKIPTVSADEFPAMPELKGLESFSLSYEGLDAIVRYVGFSAATDDTRPVLSALLFRFDSAKSLTAVSTDGYRLSMLSEIPFEGELSISQLLIPSKLMGEIVKMMKTLKLKQLDVSYSAEQKSLLFSLGEIQIISRLVDGDFPAFEKIMPQEENTIINLPKDELLEAVKIASVFARQSSNIIKWQLENGQLTVKANAVSSGEGQTSLDIQEVESGSGLIAFNSKFLTDYLSSVDESEVTFVMNGSLQPGMFKLPKHNYVHVIMPVRTQDAG